MVDPLSSGTPRARTVLLLRDSLDPVHHEICLSTLRERLFQVHSVTAGSELAAELEKHASVILVRGIRTIAQLKGEVTFVREYKNWIENHRILLVGLNELAHRQTYTILRKMGYREVISVSAFRPEACRPRLIAALEQAAQVRNGSTDAVDFESDPGTRVLRGNNFEFAPPLELIQNCWLLRRPEDVRIVRGHWVVDLLGPGKLAGSWLRREGSLVRPSDGHGIWEWNPKLGIPGSLQTGMRGRWVFRGKRPKFLDYHWTFIGKKPQLTFFDGETPVADYLCLVNEQKLVIASNSRTATEKWADIHSTLLGRKQFQIPAEIIHGVQVRLANAAAPGTPWPAENAAWRDVVGISEEEERFQLAGEREIYADIQQKLVPKPQLFNLIEDPEVRQRYFRELLESQESGNKLQNALVWTSHQALKFRAALVGFQPQPDRLVLKPEDALRPEEDLNSAQVFVSIAFPRASLFFSVQPGMTRVDGDGQMALPIPKELYEVQRRKHFRLEVPENQGLYLRIGDRFYAIRTLSAGGLSFIATAEEREAFDQAPWIEDASFELETATIHCDIEIRWKQDREQLLVGVQFTKIHPKDRQRIQLFVLEASYEYLSRFAV